MYITSGASFAPMLAVIFVSKSDRHPSSTTSILSWLSLNLSTHSCWLSNAVASSQVAKRSWTFPSLVFPSSFSFSPPHPSSMEPVITVTRPTAASLLILFFILTSTFHICLIISNRPAAVQGSSVIPARITSFSSTISP